MCSVLEDSHANTVPMQVDVYARHVVVVVNGLYLITQAQQLSRSGQEVAAVQELPVVIAGLEASVVPVGDMRPKPWKLLRVANTLYVQEDHGLAQKHTPVQLVWDVNHS